MTLFVVYADCNVCSNSCLHYGRLGGCHCTYMYTHVQLQVLIDFGNTSRDTFNGPKVDTCGLEGGGAFPVHC